MPELPEVETVKRGLLEFVGNKLTKVDVIDGKLRRQAPTNLNILENKVLSSLTRRAKYLVFNFEGLELLVHLGMTGHIYKQDNSLSDKTNYKKHDRVGFIFGDKSFYLNDARRFGLVEWKSAVENFTKLGLEPLDETFTLQDFTRMLAKSNTNIKNFLFDQTKVVGLGNIYINEALYDAKISPFRIASSLKPSEITLLHEAIIKILTLAVEMKGSSWKDYYDADGNKGSFQNACKVYNHEGELRGDGTMIVKREKQNGRSTYYVEGWQI